MDQNLSSSSLSGFNPQPSSEDYRMDCSTSISQIRNEMFAQFKKMRSSFQTS